MMVLFLFFNIDGFQVLIDAAETFTIHIHTPMNDWNSIPNVSLSFLNISSRVASTFWSCLYHQGRLNWPIGQKQPIKDQNIYIIKLQAIRNRYVDSKMQGPLYCKYVVRLHFRNAACNVLVSELDYNFLENFKINLPSFDI